MIAMLGADPSAEFATYRKHAARLGLFARLLAALRPRTRATHSKGDTA